MALKILSIEIGTGLTRVVEMDYKAKKSPKIYKCFTFATPAGVLNDGVVMNFEVFAPVFKSECAKQKVHTNKAIFTITSSRIASREIKIPFVKEKMIPDMLNSNATDFFPVDMNQYHLAYRVIEKLVNGKEKQWSLNVLAVPNEVTDGYFGLAKACGLSLVALDYVGNSIAQVMRDAYKEGEAHAIVKIEEKNTLITIIDNQKVTFQRTIGMGINEAIEVVRNSNVYGENLSYEDAIDVLCGKSCIRRDMKSYDVREEEDTDANIMRTRIRVTQSLEGLVANITRMLEYYQETNDIAKLDHVYLIGLGGDFSGLGRLMRNETGQKVRVFQASEDSSVDKSVRDNKFGVSSFVACVGAGSNPLNIMQEQKKGANKDSKSSKSVDVVRLGFVMFFGGIVVAIALAVPTIMQKNDLSDYLMNLQQESNQLKASGAAEIYYEYLAKSSRYNELQKVYDMTLSRSEELVAFIEELEEKMPSSIIVMNFNASSTGVSMSMTVDSKEAVAKTLLQLKTFESVQVVNSGGLSESEDENGEKTVTFSVDLTYKSLETEVMEEGLDEVMIEEDAEEADDIITDEMLEGGGE